MKKIIALLLALLTVCSMAAACTSGSDKTTTDEPSASVTPSAPESSTVPSGGNTETTAPTPSQKPVDPDHVTVKLDEISLYEIVANDGTKLTWNHNYIAEAKDWEGTVWSIDCYEMANGESVSVFYAGDFYNKALSATSLVPNKEITISDIRGLTPDKKQGWYLRANEDGSYKIVSAGSDKFALQCTDGKFMVVLNENCTTSFTITPVENQSTQYRQWISANKKVLLRLPTDVVERVAGSNAVKRKYKGNDDLKTLVEERMQMFADDVEKTMDAYTELTGFTPYERIIVHAFNHQGVMAGVVGGDPNIYINFDWFIEDGKGNGDLEKMMLRYFAGKQDFNFCILHEMGHMYDWDRGWNFESEMQADLKATYVLFKYKDEKFGAWAAPAEYTPDQIYSYDTIELAYKGLSSDMYYKAFNNGDVEYEYSIYRAAQNYTEFVKACEANPDRKGYEALMKTFHWFQDEGTTTSSFTSKERFEKFNQLLEEYSGGEKVEDYFKAKDWKAMCARGEGLPSTNGK